MTARTYKTRQTVDVVVVGSGVAGGMMARELARAGFSVGVAQQGARLGPGDFEHHQFKRDCVSGITKSSIDRAQSFRDGPRRRPNEGDFKERTLLGAIAGTGFADWPLRAQRRRSHRTVRPTQQNSKRTIP